MANFSTLFFLLLLFTTNTFSLQQEIELLKMAQTQVSQAMNNLLGKLGNEAMLADDHSHQNSSTNVALRDCVKLYEESEYRLSYMMNSSMNSSYYYYDNDDALSWVSALMTNHITCLDGLKEKGYVGADDEVLESGNLTMLLGQALGFYAKRKGKAKPKVDAQTWLSTALTNLETCKAGFYELGVQDYVVPLMSNNVTELLSNTLALNNNGESHQEPSYKNGFPTWVKPGDRKLLQASSPASQANVVVAKDGSGKYIIVTAAINAAPKSSSGRYVIYVQAGIYNEQVQIKAKNIMLVGDSIEKTIITGSQSVGRGTTTFRSATVAVTGDGFIGQGIIFRNTAGAANHQAVALRSGSDLSAFYKCSFEGYQYTLYIYSDRQFYRECDIYGIVDFIFGNDAVVFQKCNIYARNPPNKINTITAHGRTDPNQNTGISILNCVVTAASDLKAVQSSVKTYLRRPWKEYSRTVFMKSSLDNLIDPAGWLEWNGNFALNTLYYGEYMNTGLGFSTANRVKWGGYHVITSVSETSKFSVSNFIAGNSWLPSTRVSFTSNL